LNWVPFLLDQDYSVTWGLQYKKFNNIKGLRLSLESLTPPIVLSKPEAKIERIDDLLKRVRNGKIIMPIFQGDFVWEKPDICSLFESIYRGYPVGYLLLWKRKSAIFDKQ